MNQIAKCSSVDGLGAPWFLWDHPSLNTKDEFIFTWVELTMILKQLPEIRQYIIPCVHGSNQNSVGAVMLIINTLQPAQFFCDTPIWVGWIGKQLGESELRTVIQPSNKSRMDVSAVPHRPAPCCWPSSKPPSLAHTHLWSVAFYHLIQHHDAVSGNAALILSIL